MESIINYIHNLSNIAIVLIVFGLSMAIFSAVSCYLKWYGGDPIACSYYEKTTLLGLVILIVGVLI